MKKINILIIILFVISCFVLTSCNNGGNGNNENNEDGVAEKVIIYTVNDFHGAIEEENSKYGAARLAGFIKSNQETNKDAATIVVSGGDMFQGSAISNYTQGEVVVDIMNEIGFDAMTIGNHEFDWSLSTVLEYRDNDLNNGEATFPFLGANIVDKTTSSIPEYVEPYTIVEEKGLKIGIIGYIGLGLEDDIATQMVANYEFTSPVESVKKYSKELRSEHGCDIVITVGHDGDNLMNKQIASLPSESRVDAIVNGHTHATYTESYKRADGISIPAIQTGTAGQNCGVITLEVNKDTKNVKSGSCFNMMLTGKVEKDAAVDGIVNNIVKETEHVFKRVLCTAGSYIDRYKGSKWAVNTLPGKFNVECAFINSGGIRSAAFPINAGDKVDVSKVFEIMPFDNTIKTVYLKGSYIKALINNNNLVFSDNITGDSINGYYINGKLINDDTLYSVAAVDYIFDSPSYPFYLGENSVATGILFRDVLIEDLEKINSNGQNWLG